MKILVPVKRVIDAYVTIRVKSDETGVETNNVKMSLNPFCEIAVEEAVRLKEKGIATDIIIVSIGEAKCQETIRTALAMGADRGILIQEEGEVQTLTVARALHKILLAENIDMVIMGKQSIDGENNQTGQMLAGKLGWPQATFASHIDVDQDKKNVLVTREIDGGLETLSLTLPAIITVDLRLNEPRYASLPNIMKAKQKPLKIMTLSDLSLDNNQGFKTIKISEPPKRKEGVKLENAAALVDVLKNNAKIL
jgi:electron transfer flavoprotein beta subunit